MIPLQIPDCTIEDLQVLNCDICDIPASTEGDHVITAANPAGTVTETTPEIVTYTIEEET